MVTIYSLAYNFPLMRSLLVPVVLSFVTDLVASATVGQGDATSNVASSNISAIKPLLWSPEDMRARAEQLLNLYTMYSAAVEMYPTRDNELERDLSEAHASLFLGDLSKILKGSDQFDKEGLMSLTIAQWKSVLNPDDEDLHHELFTARNRYLRRQLLPGLDFISSLVSHETADIVEGFLEKLRAAADTPESEHELLTIFSSINSQLEWLSTGIVEDLRLQMLKTTSEHEKEAMNRVLQISEHIRSLPRHLQTTASVIRTFYRPEKWDNYVMHMNAPEALEQRISQIDGRCDSYRTQLETAQQTATADRTRLNSTHAAAISLLQRRFDELQDREQRNSIQLSDCQSTLLNRESQLAETRNKESRLATRISQLLQDLNDYFKHPLNDKLSINKLKSKLISNSDSVIEYWQPLDSALDTLVDTITKRDVSKDKSIWSNFELSVFAAVIMIAEALLFFFWLKVFKCRKTSI